jgi:hypothetical protein
MPAAVLKGGAKKNGKTMKAARPDDVYHLMHTTKREVLARRVGVGFVKEAP